MGDSVLLSAVVAVFVVCSVLISVGLALYSSRRIEHPISDAFARLLAAYGVWTGSYLIMLVGPEGSLTRGAVVGQGIGAALAVAAWFAFVIEYTGDSEWIPDLAPQLLWLWAGVYGILRVVNPADLVIADIVFDSFGLFVLPREVYGPVILGQFVVALIVVAVSFVLLSRFIWRTRSLYRYQALCILLAVVANTASTLLFLFGFQLHPQLDLTPVLYAGQGVVIWFALYQYDFLRTAPVASDRFFREMVDPAIIVDDELTVIEFNEAATAVVGGLEKQTTLDETAATFSDCLETAVAAPDSSVEFTTGQPKRTYDLELTEVTDQFEITQGYVVVLRDITQRKQRERQLEEQNNRLEAFADIVSHDLRNPLSTADGWRNVVAEAIDEADLETAADGVDRIETAHDRMDELIEVLLTMARQGQTVDSPEMVSVETVAREAWKTADTGELTLAVETDRTVEADPTRLQQAFENLFRNTADHAGATTVRLTTMPDGFAVEDDGRGIPRQARKNPFEFGYTTNEDGTGIGLAVVKRIVEAHGWEISVADSELGGARFEISGVRAES